MVSNFQTESMENEKESVEDFCTIESLDRRWYMALAGSILSVISCISNLIIAKVIDYDSFKPVVNQNSGSPLVQAQSLLLSRTSGSFRRVPFTNVYASHRYGHFEGF